MISFRLLAAVILAFPILTFACSCLEGISVRSSLQKTEAVFRGLVLRKLKDVEYASSYVVSVERMYKGCNFKAADRIVVTTGINSAMCGLELEVDRVYAFSAFDTPIIPDIQSQLKESHKIKRAVSIGLCDYNGVEWKNIPATGIKRLRRYDNTKCKVTCETGTNCLSTQYCDVDKCVAYNATCANPVNCVASPCSVSTCTEKSKCYNNYCGGCNAIFVDSTGTRVCNPNQ